MRIGGGLFRGRSIASPRGLSTRPTSGRLKKALFDILAPLLPGARVLDLFAGGGALGLEAITDIKENVSIPVVAIGGIKEENAAQVREAGADCIAVISAVVSADNIEEAARNLRKKFLAAKQTGGES